MQIFDYTDRKTQTDRREGSPHRSKQATSDASFMFCFKHAPPDLEPGPEGNNSCSNLRYLKGMDLVFFKEVVLHTLILAAFTHLPQLSPKLWGKGVGRLWLVVLIYSTTKSVDIFHLKTSERKRARVGFVIQFSLVQRLVWFVWRGTYQPACYNGMRALASEKPLINLNPSNCHFSAKKQMGYSVLLSVCVFGLRTFELIRGRWMKANLYGVSLYVVEDLDPERLGFCIFSSFVYFFIHYIVDNSFENFKI